MAGHRSIERLVENKLHRAKIYLNSITDQLRDGPLAQLNLSITWSVTVAQDVAHAIIQMAENGEDAEGAGRFGRCDLIAIATHGRGGLASGPGQYHRTGARRYKTSFTDCETRVSRIETHLEQRR